MSKENAMAYIDHLAPEHSRTSCEEGESYNAAFVFSGVQYNKCERCTLTRVARLALGEVEPYDSDDDQ